MDLTRFLRNRSNSDNPASPNPAGSLMPPPQPSGALSSASSEEDNDPSLKNSRHAMHKAKKSRSHLTDRRARADTHQNLRKDKKEVDFYQRRGIVVSDVEIEEDEEENEIVFSNPDLPAKPATRSTRAATATARQPLAAKQAQSARPAQAPPVNDRRKRLEEYLKKKQAKKDEDAKKKKPVFKTGLYKPEMTIRPVNFQWNASKQNIQFGARVSTVVKQQPLHSSQPKLRSKRDGAVAQPRHIPFINIEEDNDSKESGCNQTQPVSTKTVEPKQAMGHVPNFTESGSSLSLPDEEQKMDTQEVSQPEAVPKVDVCQAPVASSCVDEQFQTEHPTKDDKVFVKVATSQNSEKQANVEDLQTPPTNKKLISIVDVVFKTPIGITPSSRMRGRSARRRTEAGLLLDSLRTEICMERGSSSDRKRRKLGLPASRTPAEILGIEDILLDNFSPMTELIRKNNLTSEEEESSSENKVLTPRKLDSDFDQSMEEDSNICAEPNKDVAAEKEETAVVDRTPKDDTADIDQTNKPAVDLLKESQTATKSINEKELEVFDVPYFRRKLKEETDRLEVKCKIWTEKINDSLTPDVQDQIRTVVGLARLAMNKKGRFHQFEGLIDDCEFKRGERLTTCQDLQGFWDMIYYQMEDLDKKFDEMSKLEANNWVAPQPEKKRLIRKIVAKPVLTGRPKPVSGLAAAKSASIRAMIEAKRRAMSAGCEGQQENGSTKSPALSKVQITVSLENDKENAESETVFDGGFFKVKTPSKSATNTPISEVKPRKSGGFTPARKPINKRISELMMSTHKLRKSVCFDQDEDMDHSFDNKTDLQSTHQSCEQRETEPVQVQSSETEPEPEKPKSRSSSRRKSVKICQEVNNLIPQITLSEHEPMEVDSKASTERRLITELEVIASPTPLRRGRKSKMQDSIHLTPEWKSSLKRKSPRSLSKSPSLPSKNQPGRKSPAVTFDETEHKSSQSDTPFKRSNRKSLPVQEDEPKSIQSAPPLKRSSRKSVALQETEQEKSESATPLKRSNRKSVAAEKTEQVKSDSATPLKRSSRKSVSVQKTEQEKSESPLKRSNRKSAADEKTQPENNLFTTPLKRWSRRSIAVVDSDNESPVESGRKSVALKKADTEPELTPTRSARKSVKLDTPLLQKVVRGRKSVIPDLILFETPESPSGENAFTKTPSKRASKAPSALDSSLTDFPPISLLPPTPSRAPPLTPRRSTRVSMQISKPFGTPFK